jgi:hypothetical protein
LLDELRQTAERFIPTLRDLVEIAAGRFHLIWFQLPDSLTATPNITDEAGAGQNIQVLRDGLSRDRSAGAQPRDGERAVRAEPGHNREPVFVT